MSLEQELVAIETFLIAQWAGATPIGMDGHDFTPVKNSIQLAINNGAVLQGSIGLADNRIDHIGLVQIMVYTEASEGSIAWRGYAETLMGIFQNARITTAGVAITGPADEFIRFSPGDQHPYIAGHQVNGSLRTTTFNAPFVRYE